MSRLKLDRLNSGLVQLALLPSVRPLSTFMLRVWGKRLSSVYDIRNTITIHASPRGGSTWLAEVVQTLEGYVLLWEPVSLGSNPEISQLGFYPDTYLPQGTYDPQKRAYLHGVLTGRTLSLNHLSPKHFEVRLLRRFRGFLVKFVRGSLLLPWLLEQFPVRSIILIRHPCAVVASQLNWDAWYEIKDLSWTEKARRGIWRFPPEFQEAYPHIHDIYRTITRADEFLALDWAIQTYVPLMEVEPGRCLLTTYEKLVVEGQQELGRIFGYLGHRTPDAAICQLGQASTTTQRGSPFARGQGALTGWRQTLNSDQVKRIVNIVHRVGVDFYDDGLVPDYGKLDSFWSDR